MSDRLDAFPPVREVTIERHRSGWILVRLEGTVVWKRYTRDLGFTRIKVEFYSNRSPAVPRSREAFTTCHLLGNWRNGRRVAWGRNGFRVDLPAPGEHVTCNSDGAVLRPSASVLAADSVAWDSSQAPF